MRTYQRREDPLCSPVPSEAVEEARPSAAAVAEALPVLLAAAAAAQLLRPPPSQPGEMPWADASG